MRGSIFTSYKKATTRLGPESDLVSQSGKFDRIQSSKRPLLPRVLWGHRRCFSWPESGVLVFLGEVTSASNINIPYLEGVRVDIAGAGRRR